MIAVTEHSILQMDTGRFPMRLKMRKERYGYLACVQSLDTMYGMKKRLPVIYSNFLIRKATAIMRL